MMSNRLSNVCTTREFAATVTVLSFLTASLFPFNSIFKPCEMLCLDQFGCGQK